MRACIEINLLSRKIYAAFAHNSIHLHICKFKIISNYICCYLSNFKTAPFEVLVSAL